VSSELIVGLTGGIGSGKSAVCREFEHRSVPIIDADIVAREVVAPGSAGLAEVLAAFGRGILDPNGSVDRGKLRQLIFADDRKRDTLEAILHPKIRASIGDQLAAVESPYCILCVPLLVEKGGYKNVNRILLVDCPTEIQIHRVMDRDNLTRKQVEAIMATQATRDERLRMADDIIENSDRIEALETQVQALHAKYMAIAEQTRLERQSNAEHRDRTAKQPISGG
jgi:dephospho-CoA kinase